MDPYLLPTQIAEGFAVEPANELVGHQTDDADHQDTREDLRRLYIALRRPDHIADTGIGSDDLGDDQIGPAPAEGYPQIVDHAGQHGRQEDVAHQFAIVGPERPAGLDILLRHAPGIVGDQEHELEEGAEPEQRDLRHLADPQPDHRQGHQ